MTDAGTTWQDAVAAIGCVVESGLSLTLRARSGPVRDRLLAMLDARTEVLRITADSDPDSLAGGVDLIASVAAGRSVRREGLAERARGRVLLVAGAERVPPTLAATLARSIEDGSVRGAVLLDEGVDDDRVPRMLADRMAMTVDVTMLSLHDLDAEAKAEVRGLGDHHAGLTAHGDAAVMVASAAAALGIASSRPPLHALSVARAWAASGGRDAADDDALAFAARVALAPHATQMPSDQPTEAEADTPADTRQERSEGERDVVLDAALTALPPGLLEANRRAARGVGRGSADARRGAGQRGRPGRVLNGVPGRGARLDLTATLIAAAPMQRLRGRGAAARVAVRRDDLRIRRPQPSRRAATVFAVDASGSAALARLAEVKGAVERLLAESYVRRDEVALVAFRGLGAETLLPPTRALARARRALADLPGGGATPLAAGIVAGLETAIRARAAGRAPLLLLLTDGGANVARDGTRDRGAAACDADAAAALVAASGVAAIVVDSAPRGDARLERLAAAMRARYVRLPRPDDRSLAALAGARR